MTGTKIKGKTVIVDYTPRNLLTHKKLLERMAAVLEMVERQSDRVNNRIEHRKSIFYQQWKDEPKFEISLMALNRLINYYNDMRFQLMESFLPMTDREHINKVNNNAYSLNI